MVLVSRKTGKQFFFDFFFFTLSEQRRSMTPTSLFPKNRPIGSPPPLPSKSLPNLASERQEFSGSVILALRLVHLAEGRKIQGLPLQKHRNSSIIKGFAPVTGKVGFSRTCYNFCWAGGL